MAKSNNKSFFSKVTKKAKKDWDKGRKGTDNSLVKVEDGKYTIRFKGYRTREVNGNLIISIDCIAVRTTQNKDNLGKSLTKEFELADVERKNYKRSLEENIGDLCSCLQCFGEETEDLAVDELEGLLDSLTEDQPACKVSVKTSPSGFKNVWFNEFVEESDDIPTIDEIMNESDDDDDDDDDTEDEEDTEDNVDSDSDDDDDSDDDTDEEGDDDYQVGEVVQAKIGRSGVKSYRIKKINEGDDEEDSTVDLECIDTKKIHKNKSFDVIVEED